MTTTLFSSRTTHRRARLLRFALGADAAVTAANGVVYLLAAPLLQPQLGLGATTLRSVGVFLCAFGIVVWWVARRSLEARRAAGVVIAVNLTWVAASLTYILTAADRLSSLGSGWVALQAVAVLCFGLGQAVALRGSR